jgi:predicted ABC-type ATPase
LAPKRFKEAGYKIHLLFLGLSDPDLSELRVADRVVTTKGHYVDRVTIEANFEGNLEKLDKYHDLIDDLTIIDTSEIHHSTIARIIDGEVHSAIPQSQLPWWFKKYMPNITSLIH